MTRITHYTRDYEMCRGTVIQAAQATEPDQRIREDSFFCSFTHCSSLHICRYNHVNCFYLIVVLYPTLLFWIGAVVACMGSGRRWLLRVVGKVGVDRKHHSGLMRYRDTCMAREGWSIAWCTITLNDWYLMTQPPSLLLVTPSTVQAQPHLSGMCRWRYADAKECYVTGAVIFFVQRIMLEKWFLLAATWYPIVFDSFFWRCTPIRSILVHACVLNVLLLGVYIYKCINFCFRYLELVSLGADDYLLCVIRV